MLAIAIQQRHLCLVIMSTAGHDKLPLNVPFFHCVFKPSQIFLTGDQHHVSMFKIHFYLHNRIPLHTVDTQVTERKFPNKIQIASLGFSKTSAIVTFSTIQEKLQNRCSHF